MGIPKSIIAAAIIALAKTFLGQPYVWGGETPETGFDCSGLVKWCYGQHGIQLPKWAKAQWQAASTIPGDQSVDPGALAFFANTYDMRAVHGDWVEPPFISHVGLWLGDGTMLNANSEKGVVIESINTPYWKKHFHSFKGVIPDDSS